MLVFFFKINSTYINDDLNDFRDGWLNHQASCFFWFCFAFSNFSPSWPQQDPGHQPPKHHLPWTPTKNNMAPCTKQTWHHTGQDKLLSSIQDPSYEFQSGGKSPTGVRVVGTELAVVLSQFEERSSNLPSSTSFTSYVPRPAVHSRIYSKSDDATRVFPSFFSFCFILVWLALDIFLWNKRHLSVLWTGQRGWNTSLALVDLNRRWVKVVAVSSLIIKMVPDKTTDISIWKWWMFKDKSSYKSHSPNEAKFVSWTVNPTPPVNPKEAFCLNEAIRGNLGTLEIYIRDLYHRKFFMQNPTVGTGIWRLAKYDLKPAHMLFSGNIWKTATTRTRHFLSLRFSTNKNLAANSHAEAFCPCWRS